MSEALKLYTRTLSRVDLDPPHDAFITYSFSISVSIHLDAARRPDALSRLIETPGRQFGVGDGVG